MMEMYQIIEVFAPLRRPIPHVTLSEAKGLRSQATGYPVGQTLRFAQGDMFIALFYNSIFPCVTISFRNSRRRTTSTLSLPPAW